MKDFEPTKYSQLSPAQRKALVRLTDWLNDRIESDRDRGMNPSRIEISTLWEKNNGKAGMVSVIASFEAFGLSESNLLRFILDGNHHYHAMIGERGGLSLVSGPKSLNQFRGGSFLGVRIPRDYRGH